MKGGVILSYLFIFFTNHLQIHLWNSIIGFRSNDSGTNISFLSSCRPFHDGTFARAMSIRTCRCLCSDCHPNGVFFFQVEAAASRDHHLSHGDSQPASRGRRLVGYFHGNAPRSASLRALWSNIARRSSRPQGNAALRRHSNYSSLRHCVRPFSQRFLLRVAMRCVSPLHSCMPRDLHYYTVYF